MSALTDMLVEQGRQWVERVKDLLPPAEGDRIMDAMLATLRSVRPLGSHLQIGEVTRPMGRKEIGEALELLHRHWLSGAVVGFSNYADVDGSGRFSQVFAPEGGEVDVADLPDETPPHDPEE